MLFNIRLLKSSNKKIVCKARRPANVKLNKCTNRSHKVKTHEEFYFPITKLYCAGRNKRKHFSRFSMAVDTSSYCNALAANLQSFSASRIV